MATAASVDTRVLVLRFEKDKATEWPARMPAILFLTLKSSASPLEFVNKFWNWAANCTKPPASLAVMLPMDKR